MDAGRKEVDAKLAKLEKKIAKEYKTATKEVQKKAEAYFKKYDEQEKKKAEQSRNGEITSAEYNKWASGKILAGDRWDDLLNALTADLVNADKLAMSMVNDYLPEIYADSFNYQTYAIEKQAQLDTAFVLYNHETVAYLLTKNPKLLPKPTVDIPKDEKWNKSKITSAITQGVLQGESIPNIAKRLQSVAEMDRAVAVRNARTMTTYAEASGRLQSMYRVQNMGLHIMKEWQSTLDGRTRHTHRLLDGERKELDEPFSNGLMEPSDPDGEAAEVYNCRCGLVAWFKELNKGIEEEMLRKDASTSAMSYEEWKYQKQSKKNLQKVAVNYQKQAYSLEKSVYSNIWYNNVTVKDYANKANAIEAKRSYFKDKLKAEPQNADKWKALLKLVDDYEYNGQQYVYLQEQLKQLKEQLSKSAKKAVANAVISEERRNNAWRFTTRSEADRAMRSVTGEIWKHLAPLEKRAAWEYTSGSGSFNRPLRGYDWGWGEHNFKGVGNVPLDNEGSGNLIRVLTDVLERSAIPHDMYVVRGSNMQSFAGLFGLSESTVQSMSNEELQTLVGLQGVDKAFLSTGTAVGTGFGGEITYNIFLPENTQALYVEPFSAFGGGYGTDWDGVKTASVGSECETLVQRNTTYQIVGIRKESWRGITVDLDVVDQSGARDFSMYT